MAARLVEPAALSLKKPRLEMFTVSLHRLAGWNNAHGRDQAWIEREEIINAKEFDVFQDKAHKVL